MEAPKYERKSMEINLENLYVDQLAPVNAGNNSWCPLLKVSISRAGVKKMYFSWQVL